MSYALIFGSTSVLRERDGAYIPPDPTNADWRDYQEWLAAGNAPSDPVEPATILACTDLQFRLALNALGLRERVEAYVASASLDVRDWWDRAMMIHADSPMLQAAAAAIGKTQEDIDAAIKLGMTLA